MWKWLYLLNFKHETLFAIGMLFYTFQSRICKSSFPRNNSLTSPAITSFHLVKPPFTPPIRRQWRSTSPTPSPMIFFQPLQRYQPKPQTPSTHIPRTPHHPLHHLPRASIDPVFTPFWPTQDQTPATRKGKSGSNGTIWRWTVCHFVWQWWSPP